MHIIVIVVVLAGLAYVVGKLFGGRGGQASAPVRNLPFSTVGQAAHPIGVAFIAEGKVFHQAPGGAVNQIHSPYVQEAENKVARSNERNAWKKGTTFEVSANRGMRQFDNDNAQISATALAFDANNALVYFLHDQAMGGLFSYNVQTGVEQRLLHRQNLWLNDLHIDASKGKILASSQYHNGVANLAMLDLDGSRYQEITGGDTVDSAPVWVPGGAQQIVFQSAGIARHASGGIIAISHTSLQMLDLVSGNISPVLDDPQYDFLMPRFDGRGNLLYIRRPYETPKYETGNFLLDTLLFPFRLLRALFHYLNFFSIMYSRKPLTSASGPAHQADLKEIMLKGKRINAEKALRQESPVNGISSLVPKSWQLVCHPTHGQDQVLACNVASFDLAWDGTIIYSNGRAVFALGADNASRIILKSDLVGDIVAEKAPLV